MAEHKPRQSSPQPIKCSKLKIRTCMAKIYLSSTFEDLKDYRKAVHDALREIRHDVRQMEDYTASEKRPLHECLSDVADADLYVGIIAWRYGHGPIDEEHNPQHESITTLEYRCAREHSIPTFVFATKDSASWPRNFIDESTQNIDAFREELKSELNLGWFETPEELGHFRRHWNHEGIPESL